TCYLKLGSKRGRSGERRSADVCGSYALCPFNETGRLDVQLNRSLPCQYQTSPFGTINLAWITRRVNL
ncbi:MAG: hypothetical protein NT020_02780, partial [Chloroflexales bacterium]|nr:hypothetical protein [Chloroflexales bacterium]